MLDTFRDDLPWSMIKGSSSAYTDALLRCYPPDEIHMEKAVQSIGSDEGQLWLKTAAGTAHFDNIILAIPATEALKILGDWMNCLKDFLSRNTANICDHQTHAQARRRARALGL
jgi:predicted NAD/FAD-binding protein